MKGVWIDTDLALGSRHGDVDDGWAIAALALGPARLLGISTVTGNATANTAARCARKLLEECGSRDGIPWPARAPVIMGASRAGQVTVAAEAIATLPEGTHVLAIGPLTNVAAALARDPSLASRVTVHIVGGNLTSRGRWPRWWPREFNLWCDPDAAAAVFRAPLRRRLHPLDECRRLTVSALDLWRLSRCMLLGSYLARHSLRWLLTSPLRLRALRFPVWDLAPALDVMDLLPARVERHRLAVRGRGLLVADAASAVTEVVRGLDRDAALANFRRLLRYPGT